MNYDKYTFFWSGPFSQWYASEFKLNGEKFCTAEQYMMYMKAKLFGDEEIANQIMKTHNPKEQKALGRKVRNFDPVIWNKHADQIVFDGSYAKYTQNASLLALLLETDGSLLVEASPYDKIWGIGMSAAEADRVPPSKWKGENRLGIALTKVREKIVEEMLEDILKESLGHGGSEHSEIPDNR
jgi:hypothetical protein